MKTGITCPHCAHNFILDKSIHYIVEQYVSNFPFECHYIYYEAWDCPKCGGQLRGFERFIETDSQLKLLL